MSIKMRLDTAGLRALIASNPDLEIEIGKEVLKNLKDDFVREKIEEALAGKINLVLRSLVENKGKSWSPKWVPIHEGFTAAVNKIAADAITGEAEKILDKKLEQAVNLAVNKAKEGLTKEILEFFRQSITPEVAKEIIREKLLV